MINLEKFNKSFQRNLRELEKNQELKGSFTFYKGILFYSTIGKLNELLNIGIDNIYSDLDIIKEIEHYNNLESEKDK